MAISRSERVDAEVLVVGAGPAGLAAAVTAADRGATVIVVDAETGPGGQYWRHPARRSDWPAVARYHHDLDRFRELVAAFDGHRADRRVEYLPQHEVWWLGQRGDDFSVNVVDRRAGRSARVVTARSLVLATGAFDLQVPFPGWDLPGVLTAGGAQSLLKGHEVVAGRRIMVAGTGPFLLSVAAGLARAGATVVGVHDSASPRGWLRQARAVIGSAGKLGEGAGYVTDLVRHRVPFHGRSTVLAAHGNSALTSVTVAPLDRNGQPFLARRREVQVDTLAVGWGFIPRLELPQALGCALTPGPGGIPVVVVDDDQRTSVDRVFVAGEVCGVGGAALADAEGVVAGAAAAGGSAGKDASPAGLRSRVRSLRSFAAAMHEVHPVPATWQSGLDRETVVCRCEEVTAGALADLVDRDDVADARTAKLLGRAGMGWCQGRVCGYAVSCLTARPGRPPVLDPAPRPVAAPVRLGMVAGAARVDADPSDL